MSLINFNAQGVPPATGELEPIPAAWYDVAMDQSEMKPTKDAATTGNAFLECRFNVLSGQYAGRKLYTRLNIKNNNPVASEIAYKELSAICHAVGIMQVQDSQQLHGIPLKVKVKVRAAEGNYGASNDITTFKPANFVPDAPTAGAPQMPGMPTMPAAVAPPMGMPQQGWAPPPMQQPMQQQAPQQPWAQPGAQQPPAQPWAAPPMQQPPMQQPPVQQPMQQPAQQAPQQPQQPQQPAQGYPQQPWTQAPAQQPQAPQQSQAPTAAPQQWPAGGDPQQAVPPWQRTN